MWQTTTHVWFLYSATNKTWLFADARCLKCCMQNNKRLVEKVSQVLHLFIQVVWTFNDIIVSEDDNVTLVNDSQRFHVSRPHESDWYDMSRLPL